MTDHLVLTRHIHFLSRSTNAAPAGPDALSEAAESFIRASISDNTRKAYRSDLAHYTAWGGTLPATPEQVARYLADHADTLAPIQPCAAGCDPEQGPCGKRVAQSLPKRGRAGDDTRHQAGQMHRARSGLAPAARRPVSGP